MPCGTCIIAGKDQDVPPHMFPYQDVARNMDELRDYVIRQRGRPVFCFLPKRGELMKCAYMGVGRGAGEPGPPAF